MTDINIYPVDVEIVDDHNLSIDLYLQDTISVDIDCAVPGYSTLPLIVSEGEPITQEDTFWYNLEDDSLNIVDAGNTWQPVPYTVPVETRIVKYTIPLSGLAQTIDFTLYSIKNLIRYTVIIDSTLEIVETKITKTNTSLTIESNIELTGHSLIILGN